MPPKGPQLVVVDNALGWENAKRLTRGEHLMERERWYIHRNRAEAHKLAHRKHLMAYTLPGEEFGLYQTRSTARRRSGHE